MNHEDFENKLLQYYYGELEEAGRKEFEAHLKGCAKCSKELESLKAVSLELDRAFKDAGPGPEALAQIMARAREKDTRPSVLAWIFRPRWAFSMAAGVALFIALAVAWMVFMRPSRENYDFNQVAMNLESVAQDLDSLSANTQEEQGAEADLDQPDSGMAANDLSYLNEDQKLDSMDREISDIEVIANGIF